MKKIIATGFILALCMLIIPFSVPRSDKKALYTGAAAKASAGAREIPAHKESEETFRIKTEDKIVTLSAEEYIKGVVAAEMPVSYETEALKAQSVAAYSFALYRKEHNSGKDYDLTDSYKTDQSFLDAAALKEKWGDSYEANIAKIAKAVKAVSGERLKFGGKTALALYHSLSCGKTNSCADIFGSDVKYLVCVNSKSDALSPDCKSEISLGEDELGKKVSSLAGEKKGGSLKIIETGKSGCVTEVSIGGKSVSGVKLAGVLNLPSPNFTVKHSAHTYIFICMGRGHGVGMSQYGAGQMALAGSTYREILAHYYPGTVLEKN